MIGWLFEQTKQLVVKSFKKEGLSFHEFSTKKIEENSTAEKMTKIEQKYFGEGSQAQQPQKEL